MTAAVDPHCRSAEGCLCCGEQQLRRSSTLVSPYLAEKAWHGTSELTMLAVCESCGFRFFDRGLSSQEAASYYQGYRDENYLRERHRHEPFYTRRRWSEEGEWLRSDDRRVDLRDILAAADLGNRFRAVLDHGGGNGHLIRWLDAGRKAVFDLSGEAPEPGIEAIADEARLDDGWDLVVSSHVLEHLSDPSAMVDGLARLLVPGGHLYAEVPDELWHDASWPGAMRDAWLRRVVGRPRLRLACDIYSTAFRVKLGVLPPLGFVPTREHLNYFTEDALRALATRHGLVPKLIQRNSKGHFCMVAQRPGTH